MNDQSIGPSAFGFLHLEARTALFKRENYPAQQVMPTLLPHQRQSCFRERFFNNVRKLLA
jgi:hypothetical protein